MMPTPLCWQSARSSLKLPQQLLFLDLNYNFSLERHIDAIVAMFPNAHVEALLNFDD
jgi:hypothetical protein